MYAGLQATGCFLEPQVLACASLRRGAYATDHREKGNGYLFNISVKQPGPSGKIGFMSDGELGSRPQLNFRRRGGAYGIFTLPI